MNSKEKEVAVLDTILLLIPVGIREYPDFSDGAAIFIQEVKDRILGVANEEVDKIMWRLNELKVIEYPPFKPDLFLCYTADIRKYRNKVLLPLKDKISLVLYSDNYLCVEGISRHEKSCHFRARANHKRLKLLKIFAQNNLHRFSGPELRQLHLYENENAVRKELKILFSRIAKDLGYSVDELLESNNNGYLLKCYIQIEDTLAP